MPANMENSPGATGLKKVSFHSNNKESQCQGIFKLPHNHTHFICYQSTAQNSPNHAKFCLVLQASSGIENFQMFKMDLEKAEIKFSTSSGSQKKQENSRKTSTSASLTMLNPLILWSTTNCGKFLKKWGYQTTLPASQEICTQVKKQQLEPDMEPWTGSKLGKYYVEAVYCHPAYLTYMQSTLCEMPGWMKHSWNQNFQEEYQ